MRHFIGWEIFCHRLPKLVKLTIVFIGDECPTGQFPKEFTYKSKDVQQVLLPLGIDYEVLNCDLLKLNVHYFCEPRLN